MGLRGEGYGTGGCRASPLGVQVKVLREWGQDTVGVGSSYCGGKVIPKGEAIGHTMGCWVSICGVRV